MKPRLVFNSLTGRVDVVTRYKVSVGPDGRESLEVIGDSQFDITEDFDQVARERLAAMFPTTHLKKLSRRR
jgi:hypothetical protein